MTSKKTVPTIALNDDLEMPQLGLGTYKLRGQECVDVIRAAIELGYRHFDTATLYDNEEALGRALRDAIAAGDVTRDELFVTTKVWHDHHGADKVQEAFHVSLDRLGLDFVDLYLIHWPWAPGGLYVETFEAMARFEGMGQVRSIGVANFYEETLQALIDGTGIVPVVNQVELHTGFTQPELRAFHDQHGIATQAWAPLARGSVFNNADIKAIAAAHDATPAQVVLAHLMQHGVTVIPKSARRGRLEENLRAIDVELTRSQMETLDSLDGREGFGRMFNDPRQWPDAEG